MSRLKKLSILEKKKKSLNSPDEFELDSVTNPHPKSDYVVRLTAPEFTSICPVTGQPDFGIIIIDYVPNKLIVESKSFKLFYFLLEIMVAFMRNVQLKLLNQLRHLLNLSGYELLDSGILEGVYP